MIYRGLKWTPVDVEDRAAFLAAKVVLQATAGRSEVNPGAVIYSVDALDPSTGKPHRLRSAWLIADWLYVVNLSVMHALKSFDAVPLEIHAIEDEIAYEAAKGAYLATLIISE